MNRLEDLRTRLEWADPLALGVGAALLLLGVTLATVAPGARAINEALVLLGLGTLAGEVFVRGGGR